MPELFSAAAIGDYLRKRGYDLDDVTDQHISLKCRLGGREVHLLGEFTSRFPFEPPEIYVQDRLQYGHLAHVGWRQNPSTPKEDLGLVCKGVGVARSVNFEAPELVFEYGLEAACSVLGRAIECEEYNRTEILAEFSGHWRFHCGKSMGRHTVLVEPSGSPESLDIYMPSSTFFTYWPEEILENDGYGLRPKVKIKAKGKWKGLYVPIDTPVLPPKPEESTLDWWHSTVLPILSSEALAYIENWCRRYSCKKNPYHVIISIHRGGGQFSWAGFFLKYKSPLCYKKKNALPLFSGSPIPSGWKVEAFEVQIHNQSFLLSRGGAAKELSTEKILLIGCGSLGG